jgi:hypothetical protein
MLHQCAILCNKMLQIIFNCTKLHTRNLHALVALTGEHMKKLLIVTALLCGAAHAQQSSIMYTGQDLYVRMTSSPNLVNGYIAGVADAHSGITICIPPGRVTLGQMFDMVKQTLERVPSERHLSADIYVQASLENRWPCAKKGSGV